MEEFRSSKKMYFGKTKRRRFPFRFFLFLLFLLIIIYLIFGSLGWGRKEKIKDYITSTNKIVEKSNKVAQDFEKLRKNANSYDRLKLKEALKNLSLESKKILKKAEDTRPPSEAESAHKYLLLALKLRAKGTSYYQTSLFNALKDIDLEVATMQVREALMLLALSDRAYTLYEEEMKKIIEDNKIDAKIVKSRFIADEGIYEKANLFLYLTNLKGMKSLEEIHEIEVVDFTTRPRRTRFITSRNLAILPSTNNLSVMIVVENKGNQIEYSIPVSVTLKSTASLEEQKKKQEIVSLEPGERKTVTLSGFRPASGWDVVNLLTISAGPVPKEKQTTNNVKEYKFSIR